MIIVDDENEVFSCSTPPIINYVCFCLVCPNPITPNHHITSLLLLRFFLKKKQTLQLFLLFHFYYIFFTYFHHAALAQKKGKSKTPTPVQQPPYISPYTFNNLAASVYGPNEGDWSVYQGCNGWGLYAQAFGLDQLGMRCLEFHTFVGKGFGGPKDANWQITLIEQNTQQFGSQKLMLFEGTTPQIGSWIMDVKNIVGIDPPTRRLIKLMAKKMTSWEQKHNFTEYFAFTGHSAGCLFTKYACDEEQLLARGNPWRVCWNGFDPYIQYL